MKINVAGGHLYDTEGETHWFVTLGREEKHRVISLCPSEWMESIPILLKSSSILHSLAAAAGGTEKPSSPVAVEIAHQTQSQKSYSLREKGVVSTATHMLDLSNENFKAASLITH